MTPHVASKLDAAEDRYMFGGGLPTFVHAGVRSTRGQLFDGLLDDELIIHRSATPLLEACRVLRERGIDPAAPIVMRYAGSDCDALRTTVGHAAGLTVSDRKGPPTFEPWRASPRSAGSLPTRQIEPAATLVPEALIVRLHGRGALTCHI